MKVAAGLPAALFAMMSKTFKRFAVVEAADRKKD